MGTGVEQAASPILLTGLPVPSTGEASPGGSDVDNLAQHARVDHFLNFVKEGLQAVVLERREQAVIVLGRFDNAIELRYGFAAGFLTDDVVSPFEGRDTGFGM